MIFASVGAAVLAVAVAGVAVLVTNASSGPPSALPPAATSVPVASPEPTSANTILPSESANPSQSYSAPPAPVVQPFNGTVCSQMPVAYQLTYANRSRLNPSAVRAVQSALRDLRYTGTSGTTLIAVDGDFGSHTDYAVRNFQRDVGLLVDGQVGPSTWGALGDSMGLQSLC